MNVIATTTQRHCEERCDVAISFIHHVITTTTPRHCEERSDVAISSSNTPYSATHLTECAYDEPVSVTLELAEEKER